MPRQTSSALASQARLLSSILKAIRADRRMTVLEVAQAMGLSKRCYEDFEAGRGKLDLAKVRLFGRATDSDAVAITLGLLFGAPESALRAIRNKAPSILWLSLQEFEGEVGEQMSVIPGTHLLEAFRQAFGRLREFLQKRDASAERWLEMEIQRLYTPPAGAPDETN